MSMVPSTATISSESKACDEISLWKPDDGLTGTLTFGVRTPKQVFEELQAEWDENAPFRGAEYSFHSYDALHKGLAPNRMAILRMMMGQGPLSIREIARRVGRDFKGVHSDVSSMFTQGLLYKSEDGRMVFPYDSIRFDFTVGGETQSAA